MYEWMYLDPNKKNSKMFHFISFSGKIFFNQKLQKGKIENCHKYLNPLPNQIFRRNSVGVKHAWPKCCIRYGAHWSWRFFKSSLLFYVLGALFFNYWTICDQNIGDDKDQMRPTCFSIQLESSSLSIYLEVSRIVFILRQMLHIVFPLENCSLSSDIIITR